MKKTATIKIILDIILAAAILTLYSKNFVSMKYHELAGLCVLIPILAHICINIKIIRGMCRNFQRVPFNIRLCLITDILLLVVFVWMAVSGVMISRTILTNITGSSRLFKISHKCLGGYSIILLGLHVGLHMCRRKLKAVTASLLTVLALATGIYGFTNSTVIQWISMPFSSAGGMSTRERTGNDPFNVPHTTENGGERQDPDQFPSDTIQPDPSGTQPMTDRMPQNNKEKMRENDNHAFGPQTGIRSKAGTFLQFFGIFFSVSLFTYWVVILLRKAKSRSKQTQ